MAETHGTGKYIKQIAKMNNCYFVSGASTSSAETGSTTNIFSRIQFITSGNLSSVVSTQITNSTDISSGTTYAAGTEIVAKMTSVKTKAGDFMVYNWS